MQSRKGLIPVITSEALSERRNEDLKKEKYKIFVSGNQKELREEMRAAKEIIVMDPVLYKLFEEVFLFEDLPAQSGSAGVICYKKASESDIYLGIIWNRYSNPTEREFDSFVEHNPDAERWVFIKGRDDSKRDKETVKFIEKVRAGKDTKKCITANFTNIDNLQTQVLNSLIFYLDEQRSKKTIEGKTKSKKTVTVKQRNEKLREKETGAIEKSTKFEEFDVLRGEVYEFLECFKSAIVTLIFNEYTGNKLIIDRSAEKAAINEAIAQQYIDKNLKVLWDKTDTMRATHEALEKLDDFIKDRVTDEILDECEKRGYIAPLDIKNLDFWEDALRAEMAYK